MKNIIVIDNTLAYEIAHNNDNLDTELGARSALVVQFDV